MIRYNNRYHHKIPFYENNEQAAQHAWQNPEILSMTPSNPHETGNVDPELAEQIKALTADQQLALLKDLLKNNITGTLLRIVEELPAEQQQIVASRLQARTAEPAILQETEIALRGYSRKSCMLQVRYMVGGENFDSFMLDISPAGAFIETDKAVAQGQAIHLEFSLPPDPEPVTLNGVILWKGMLGMGVKFTDPAPEQLKRISDFMQTGQGI
jgi:Tfp pilus assembly protein PilZ